MKATGVVRRIDDLGRVVIPKEIRKTLRIKEGEPLEIFTGKCIAIIQRTNDTDDKLIVVPDGKVFTDSNMIVDNDDYKAFIESLGLDKIDNIEIVKEYSLKKFRY